MNQAITPLPGMDGDRHWSTVDANAVRFGASATGRSFFNVLALRIAVFFCLSFISAYAESPSALSFFEGFDCAMCLGNEAECGRLMDHRYFTVADVWGTKFEGYESEGFCVPPVDVFACEPPYVDVLLYSFTKVRFLRDNLKLAPGNQFSTFRARAASRIEEWDTDKWEGVVLRPGVRYRVLLLSRGDPTHHPSIDLACEFHH